MSKVKGMSKTSEAGLEKIKATSERRMRRYENAEAKLKRSNEKVLKLEKELELLRVKHDELLERHAKAIKFLQKFGVILS